MNAKKNIPNLKNSDHGHHNAQLHLFQYVQNLWPTIINGLVKLKEKNKVRPTM